MILDHDWYHSKVLLLYIHGEKGTSKISPNATLELLFAKNARKTIKKRRPGLVLTKQAEDLLVEYIVF